MLIGSRIVERLQMFYSGEGSSFEAPFFVPTAKDAPDGITLRVVVTDLSMGNSGIGTATNPVLTERVQPTARQ